MAAFLARRISEEFESLVLHMLDPIFWDAFMRSFGVVFIPIIFLFVMLVAEARDESKNERTDDNKHGYYS